jgi:hypothetical protein
MLLRINFIATQERAGFMRAHTPSLYVTPRRPDFTGGGGDGTEYAWFGWDNNPPTVEILDTEKRDSKTAALFNGQNHEASTRAD